MSSKTVDITVLFNDVDQDPRVKTAHGMACLIEGMEKTVLFDTGGDGHILLDNMAALGKKPAAVDVIVISHAHWDHSGGLFTFLREAKPGVEVYMPKAVSKDFRDHADLLGAKVIAVEEPIEVIPGLFSTGQMGGDTLPDDRKEQGIVFSAEDGPVVITGCAHPGIFNIIKEANRICPGKIHAVLGGFHLREAKKDEIADLIGEIKALGVQKMGPSHCTGDAQTKDFAAAWGGEFLPFGCGAVIQVELA
jgi:7,8-dihydropterin-6-yl-methyl-4-(beta-D-ribofuranosyl)aminobenzene 5'-phosphate synthase